MPSDLDYSITDAMTPTPMQKVEKKIVTMNPKYEMYVTHMKPRIPGGYVPPERFIPEYEGATQYMGADSGGGEGQAGPGIELDRNLLKGQLGVALSRCVGDGEDHRQAEAGGDFPLP